MLRAIGKSWGSTIGCALLVLLALAAPAAAQVQPYAANDAGGFRDVLADGGQLGLYTAGTFKDASFGVAPGDEAASTTPRADVTILRDRGTGVAHVYGTSREGAMFGAGYANAQDRLFLMDVLRHAGRATLSSFLGGSAQAIDAEQWRVAPYSEADLTRQWNRLPHLLAYRGTLLQRDVEAYVAGVNAEIAELQAAPARLPREYAAIGRPQGPDPWTPEDVVATSGFIGALLAGDAGQLRWARARAALVGRLGRVTGTRALRGLEAMAGTPAPQPRAHASRRAREARALPDARSLHATRTATPSPPATAAPLRIAPTAAGALLVAARASATGHPLLVAGPQLPYLSPGLLTEADVHAPASAGLPGIDARGVAVAGLGFYVQSGHGRDYAWSATPSGRDLGDTFAVALCVPGGGRATTASRGYRYGGRCRRMQSFDRTNAWVPNAIDPTPAGTQTLHAERTRLGLVVARGWVRHRPVAFTSLRPTYLHGLDSEIAYQALNEPASVRSMTTFVRAAGKSRDPLDWAYADARRVAAFRSGADPVRARGVDRTLPVRGVASDRWRRWDPMTWTARQHARRTHTQSADPRSFALAVGAKRELQRAVRRGPVDLAGLVSLMAANATSDVRARTVLPSALRILGHPRDPVLAGAVAQLRAWLAAGAPRRDANGDGVYEDSDAVRVMDAWWPRLIAAQFRPRLGAGALRRVAAATGGDDPPGGHGAHQGAASRNPWYGIVRADLRAVLDPRDPRPLGIRYCGGGHRAACRRALASSLRDAAGVPAAAVYGGDATCQAAGRDGDQACADAIAFRRFGLAAAPILPWADRPLYQEAVSVAVDLPSPPPLCGEVRHAAPTPAPAAPPLLVGDSVAMGALRELANAGFEVDAHGCRGFAEGLEVLRARAIAGTLPRVVVMQLGTDGSVQDADIRAALDILGPDRVLALVTPREVFGHSHRDAARIRAAGRSDPAHIVVLDWARYAHGHGAWFQPDAVHLTIAGAGRFARFLRHGLARR